jgi:uncharacterized membrane protein
MGKTRLEAFSDGVLAIIITIMVLEIKVPHEPDWNALQKLAPVFLSYVLSFIYVGIYWNNHHHLLHTVHTVSAKILWANLHVLFWLSLVPFASGWMGENHFAEFPTAVYGVIMLGAAVSYYMLQWAIIGTQGKNSVLRQAIGKDVKGKLSLVLYSVAIAFACTFRYVSVAIYALVALMWLIPDRRIEMTLRGK